MMEDPLELFAEWYASARAAMPDPSPMALATAGKNGEPAVRMVLLKSFSDAGFVFFTNLHSRKGRELRENARAALCFYWAPLQKQVRIEGPVTQVSDAEADAYFQTRPHAKQIGAWASKQTERLDSRETLLERCREIEKKFAGGPVPRPPFWSGYRVEPLRFEFWIGHEDRLNERILYERQGMIWKKALLYP